MFTEYNIEEFDLLFEATGYILEGNYKNEEYSLSKSNEDCNYYLTIYCIRSNIYKALKLEEDIKFDIINIFEENNYYKIEDFININEKIGIN